MGDLICPYCGETQWNHEPDQFSADMCYTECEYCEKGFWYSVSVNREYDPFKDEEESENDQIQDT